jgi:peroxiredoxin family protein
MGKLKTMNMLGPGRSMAASRMTESRSARLRKMTGDRKEVSGKIIVCEVSIQVTGIKKDGLRRERIDGCRSAGKYVNEARDSKIRLFI